ncbi:MAG TPA: GIY-YIG nuclease family protein, partial [bacterium]|nr:GIY-YIG nuclease family protein [bacterium]
MDESLRQALDRVPEDPGCYLYKDGQGKVIYVGKAINLRRRVFQYFQDR